MNKTGVAQAAKTIKPKPLTHSNLLQRKCACGNQAAAGGECAQCKKKQNSLQRKLSIGASNDPLEQEADRVAEQVLARSAHAAVNSIPPRIQRYSGAVAEGAGSVPASVDGVLANPGRPLEPALQSDMEQHFGYDLSQVRVHTGNAAEKSARDISASAYTVGKDIVFGAGQFAQGTQEGGRLLAHELTHVVQQSGIANNPVGKNDGNRVLAPAAEKKQVQRSFLSGLLDVVLFVPRLFGLEVFPADQLKEYLDGLKARKAPEDGIFSDNKARACVAREAEFGPYDAQTKILLIREMLGGHTSFLDEGAIITLLRRSQPDRQQIVSSVGRDLLWSKFSGDNRLSIEAMTSTAADAGDALVARLRNLNPDQLQVFSANATDPAVRESVRRAMALMNMTTPVPTEAVITPAGDANFSIHGVRVIVQQDQINPGLGQHAFTHGGCQWSAPSPVLVTPENANQPVGPFAPVDIFMKIWTEFASEEAKRGQSGYGVGTRPQDEHTLRYHERAHGEAWINFLRNNPPPAFTGVDSMFPAQFNTALQQWNAAMRDYGRRANDYALKAGDCVGTLPTDEQLAGTGFTAAICHEQH